MICAIIKVEVEPKGGACIFFITVVRVSYIAK